MPQLVPRKKWGFGMARTPETKGLPARAIFYEQKLIGTVCQICAKKILEHLKTLKTLYLYIFIYYFKSIIIDNI